MQIILGVIISVIVYFPIVTVFSFPFYIKPAFGAVSFPVFPILTTILEIIIAVFIIWKKPSKKNLGFGIVIGSVLMILFVIFLTPSLGD